MMTITEEVWDGREGSEGGAHSGLGPGGLLGAREVLNLALPPVLFLRAFYLLAVARWLVWGAIPYGLAVAVDLPLLRPSLSVCATPAPTRTARVPRAGSAR